MLSAAVISSSAERAESTMIGTCDHSRMAVMICGSLLVAVFAYLLMHWSLLEHLTFNFPELNLVLLALILAMGQYTGYKLSELRRFRAMDEVS